MDSQRGQSQVWFGACKFSEQRIEPSSPVSLTLKEYAQRAEGLALLLPISSHLSRTVESVGELN